MLAQSLNSYNNVEVGIESALNDAVEWSLKCQAWPFISIHANGITLSTSVRSAAAKDEDVWKERLRCVLKIEHQSRCLDLIYKSV
jgi:hypothetical protein